VRSSTVIMIVVAAVFGLLAVFVAQSWLNAQAEARLKSLEARKAKPTAAQTLVVAGRQLRFGNELAASALREVPWPTDTLPQGGFKTIEELLAQGKRVVLTAIEANEPVLAIDQLADERTDKPSVAKAVTLEVDIAGAQKLALASQIGTLALALRKAGDAEPTASRPITLADLFNSRSADEPENNGKFSTISITRAMNRTIYSVPKDGGGDRSTVVGQGTTH
jgi:Flp pilus assembly protein CpaB